MADENGPADEYRHRLTIGMLREWIEGQPSDVEFDFGNTLAGVPLQFYRLKWRADKVLQIELNEKGFGEG